MQFAALLIIARLLFPGWGTDFERARDVAKQEHRYILLNFSGSDWCGPCIRLHDEVFESQQFKELAGTNLVLLNADFPRLKKNQLPKDQQEQNEHLADKYNPKGSFPLTVLLTPDGKVVKEWEGFPAKGLDAFVSEIKAACHESN
jgi:thioredoxin-related protein